MSERMQMMKRLQDGERMTDLCREYGISRKTGYKFLARYQEDSEKGLQNERSTPGSIPHRTSEEVADVVVSIRKRWPHWGPKKIRQRILDKHPGIRPPASSTIGDILLRNHLVEPRKRRRKVAPYDAPLEQAHAPNDVWCADFKGQFRLANGAYCYPLTITDRFSRLIIACEALVSTDVDGALDVFDRAFSSFGLPRVIRTDNGIPFASRGLLGLSRLSVRWLRLGIWPERIALAHPEQNGQHERMHLVLKQETTRPAGKNMLQQQERFDRFVHDYNHERPHEAIEQKLPASLYAASPRRMPKQLATPDYPLDDVVLRVQRGGSIRPRHSPRAIFITHALEGQHVGLREVGDHIWQVSFTNIVLGCFDARTSVFQSNNDAFNRT